MTRRYSGGFMTANFSPLATYVDYLVVAGGGAGGYAGGGGGGGGFIEGTFPAVSNVAYTVTVGGGGAAAGSGTFNGPYSTNGVDSFISSTTTRFMVNAVGGGFGIAQNSTAEPGGTGGSGGGAGYQGTRGRGIEGQGNDGGAWSTSSGYGGGGGAGGVGGDGSGGTGGAGGNPKTSTIDGNSYSGGGAGTGGGGAGSAGNGGGSGTGGGANGTRGQVVIRSLTTAANTIGSPTVTTSGSYTLYTFTSSGTITF